MLRCVPPNKRTTTLTDLLIDLLCDSTKHYHKTCVFEMLNRLLLLRDSLTFRRDRGLTLTPPTLGLEMGGGLYSLIVETFHLFNGLQLKQDFPQLS